MPYPCRAPCGDDDAPNNRWPWRSNRQFLAAIRDGSQGSSARSQTRILAVPSAQRRGSPPPPHRPAPRRPAARATIPMPARERPLNHRCSSLIRYDLIPAGFHVKRAVELVDQANCLAHRGTFHHHIAHRPIVLDTLHTAVGGRKIREYVLEHDLHQSRGTGVRDQTVTAHGAVLSCASIRLHHDLSS